MAQAVNRTMPYVRLGKSGLKVSRLILGCTSYGSPGGRAGSSVRRRESSISRPFTISASRPLTRPMFIPMAVIDHVEELAKKKGVSMTQLSLSWMLHKDVVSAPIIGSTSVDKLHGLIGALDVKLSEKEIKYLEEGYEPRPFLGH